jgi:omega-amidase
MNNKLNIRLFQADIIWHSPLENLKKIEKIAAELETIDLLVCPEMMTTGFSMNVQNIAENWTGESVETLRKIAINTQTAITFTLVIQENKHYYNRLVFIFPDGEILKYDKRHLFRMGNEDKYYTQGNERLIIEYKGWKILPLICYDLRFPVWSRNTDNYDILMYLANWPDPRIHVWNSLLTARAIENQSFVIGVNRVGKDGMGLNYSGQSKIIDAKGNIIAAIEEKHEEYCDVNIDKIELELFREKFPVLKDADDFNIIT